MNRPLTQSDIDGLKDDITLFFKLEQYQPLMALYIIAIKRNMIFGYFTYKGGKDDIKCIDKQSLINFHITTAIKGR